MLSYRIEIVTEADGMAAVQAYSGEDQTPFASSGPVFHSVAEARDSITGMFEQAWPAKDPFAVDSSIGV